MFSVMNKECLEAIQKKYIEYWSDEYCSEEEFKKLDLIEAQNYLNHRGYDATNLYESRKPINKIAKQYFNLVIKRTLKRCIQFKSNKQMVKIYLRNLLHTNKAASISEIFKNYSDTLLKSFIEKTCAIVEEEMV